ncbi:hypothetical protein HYU14_05950 [Candidatus Woesearchaeota archaeon]|nr:hypothetical protein [Candidatus Woesearchaeota archaeon]
MDGMKASKEKHDHEPQEGEMNHMADLPSLRIRKITSAGDIIMEEFELESRGFSMDEAKEGLQELVRISKEHEKDQQAKRLKNP